MKFFLIALLFSRAYASDLSLEYKNDLTNIENLKKYKVLIVPGVLAESFDKKSLQPLKVNFAFEQGFNDQIKALSKNNIEYQYLNFDTESPPEKNAKSIRQAIIDSKKPVLIYSHSKGGLDTLETFVESPELLSKVHGWVSVQSPFYGSPIATGFKKDNFLKSLSENLFRWFGGTKAGFESLTFENRIAYMDRAVVRDTINLVNTKVKFLNYGSVKEDRSGIDSALEILRDISDNVAGPNDGVVPIESALLARHGFDVDYVYEEDVDHLMTMTKYRLIDLSFDHALTNYDRETHTLKLLNMISK